MQPLPGLLLGRLVGRLPPVHLLLPSLPPLQLLPHLPPHVLLPGLLLRRDLLLLLLPLLDGLLISLRPLQI